MTVPAGLLDDAFKVLVDNTPIGYMLTWNATHTSIYFTCNYGSIHNVKVIGELSTPILGDIDKDGDVDSMDLFTLAANYGKPY